MTNHQAGHEAEKQVAAWLEGQKFKIVELNWRTRRCEIDIIASKKSMLYFIEVKSRSSQAWGGGLDYITPKKLQQMRFAAEVWMAEHEWDGSVQLAAVAVDGGRMKFVEIFD